MARKERQLCWSYISNDHVPADVEMRGRRCLPGAYAPGANLQTEPRRCSTIGIKERERKPRHWRW